MISASLMGHGVSLTFPPTAAHPGAYSIGVTLTRDEAFDLLDKLRTVLASDTPPGKASQMPSADLGLDWATDSVGADKEEKR